METKDQLKINDGQYSQSNNKSLNSSYGLASFDKFQVLKIDNTKEKDSAILQTAKNSKTQVTILKDQLAEINKQNETLQKNYVTLNNLYKEVLQEINESKAELEESKKREKKAYLLGVKSFVASIVFFIGSILSSVLIALYLNPNVS